jgi:hypothetical protein
LEIKINAAGIQAKDKMRKPTDSQSANNLRLCNRLKSVVSDFIMMRCCLTSRAQAQPPSWTTKSKMTNKSHKINRHWQG